MTNNFANKVPPHDSEAEMSVLGSLMLDKDSIIKVADFLRPEDFYHKKHEDLYRVLENLFSEGEPIDIVSVSSKLKEKNLLEKMGGSAYLTELINIVPTASHVMTYGKIVQKKRILRDLISIGQDISVSGYEEERESEDLLDNAERKIFEITQKSMTQAFTSIKPCLKDAFERMEKISNKEGRLRGVTTGFFELDNYLSGLQNSDLVILAARPSMGKSSLALDIAKNVALKTDLPIGFFSLEMSNDQLIDRMISSEANVDAWKIRQGTLSSSGEDNDFIKIQHALGTLSDAPIFINDASSMTVLQMRAMARRLKSQHGLGLIVIDYLQLIEPSNKNIGSVQQITEISRQLKGLARELNVPVLALSQLSRAVETRTPSIPKLSDLRDSGSIEQDADVVLFIYREEVYKKDTPKKGIAEIIIAKHRNGPIGRLELFFDANKSSFRNLERTGMEYNETAPSQPEGNNDINIQF